VPGAAHDEGQNKDRQESLSGASEGDDLALGPVEGQSAAQISTVADLQGVIPASIGISIVSFISSDPTRPPSTTTSNVPRRTSTPMVLCVSLRVVDNVNFLLVSANPTRHALSLAPWLVSGRDGHILGCILVTYQRNDRPVTLKLSSGLVSANRCRF
jgi:hypothetical protein